MVVSTEFAKRSARYLFALIRKIQSAVDADNLKAYKLPPPMGQRKRCGNFEPSTEAKHSKKFVWKNVWIWAIIARYCLSKSNIRRRKTLKWHIKLIISRPRTNNVSNVRRKKILHSLPQIFRNVNICEMSICGRHKLWLRQSSARFLSAARVYLWSVPVVIRHNCMFK